MALTYTQLITDVQNWAEDDSAEFQTSLPQIVTRAEDRIYRDVVNLLSYQTVETGTLTSGVDTLTTTATDISSIRWLRITVSSAYVFLPQRDEGFLEDWTLGSTTTAVPQFYAIVDGTTSGTKLLIAPTPDDNYAYSLQYKRRPTGLSTTTANTYLGDTFPDLLFNAAQYEASLFLVRADKLRAELLASYMDAAQKTAAEVERNITEEG
jgi:hypothetical protein